MYRALLRRVCGLIIVVMIAGVSLAASANKPEASHAPERLDAAPFRDQLSVLTDGKGHYIAIVTFEHTETGKNIGQHFFYGDGERLYEQSSRSRSANQSKQTFSLSFWAPRAHKTKHAQVRFDEGRYAVQCGDHKTSFKPLEDGPRKAMLAKAEFFAQQWLRRAYLLARDDAGVYYFIDRARTPPDNYDFRLYTGHRGNMKQLPLVNIVSDTEGDIFASKRGRLRLVHNAERGRRQGQLEWIKGRTRKALTKVPVDLNAQLIYRDLGVYDGQRLGTACDDL